LWDLKFSCEEHSLLGFQRATLASCPRRQNCLHEYVTGLLSDASRTMTICESFSRNRNEEGKLRDLKEVSFGFSRLFISFFEEDMQNLLMSSISYETNSQKVCSISIPVRHSITKTELVN
jgi:hypothetical protein